MVEGIRLVGFKIFDLRLVHRNDGGYYGHLLGPIVLRRRLLHRFLASTAISAPADCLTRPDIWRRALLRNLHVRPLPPQRAVLATRALLLLVLLLLLELHLDRDPRM